MTYEDGEGNLTARDFDIIHIYERHNRWYFDAYCGLSDGEERTFRVDRVLTLRDHVTGESWTLLAEVRRKFRQMGRSGVY